MTGAALLVDGGPARRAGVRAGVGFAGRCPSEVHDPTAGAQQEPERAATDGEVAARAANCSYASRKRLRSQSRPGRAAARKSATSSLTTTASTASSATYCEVLLLLDRLRVEVRTFVPGAGHPRDPGRCDRGRAPLPGLTPWRLGAALPVSHRDVCAGAPERDRQGRPDPPSSTGDERAPTLEYHLEDLASCPPRSRARFLRNPSGQRRVNPRSSE